MNASRHMWLWEIWSNSSHIKLHQQISFWHFGNLQSSWENHIPLGHDQGLKIRSNLLKFGRNQQIRSDPNLQFRSVPAKFIWIYQEIGKTQPQIFFNPGHDTWKKQLPRARAPSLLTLLLLVVSAAPHATQSAGRATISPSMGAGGTVIGHLSYLGPYWHLTTGQL
jgi:hypothetical protein